MLDWGFSKHAETSEIVLQICEVGWFVFGVQSDCHVSNLANLFEILNKGDDVYLIFISLYIAQHHKHVLLYYRS